ncbi:unnamed protein product, partial [Medioppia subpectinata]
MCMVILIVEPLRPYWVRRAPESLHYCRVLLVTGGQVKFAVIGQDDHLLNRVTTFESLVYASRLKNEPSVEHTAVARDILHRLKIADCANQRPNQCSGGQRKRISIALELVSRPHVLVLDEPTTGLDSMTTWQLIRTLIKLCKQSTPAPMAIALTIHQPSAKLFTLFDSAYVMSYDGQCIYHGPPQTMTGHLGRYGLVCPDYYNPADFVLDIACKEYGIEKVMMLSDAYRSAVSANDNNLDSMDNNNNKCQFEIKTQINDTFWRSLWILIESYLYGEDNGVLSGCAVDYMVTAGDYFEHMIIVRNAIVDNGLEMAFITIAFCFGAIFPACIVFPKEINCFEKEYGNGWYSCLAYVLSKIIVDIPFQILMPSLGSFYVYYMTGQYMHPIWRMYTFAVILILISLTASAQGFLFSALFPRNPEVAATLGLTIIIPMMLFSGTLARLETMPAPLRVITYFDYLRFGLESMIVDIYGLNRCDDNPLVVNKTDFLQHFSDETLMKIYSSEVIPYEKLLSIIDLSSGSDDHFGNDGTITAILGPSGAGKSTLLSCITGHKRTGLTGSIRITTDQKVKFAVIGQDDHLLDRVTTFESLVYASRLKNEPSVEHTAVARDILNKLKIADCADQWPNQCSGGQRKRISIALELVSRPHILVLDEPTTGLDSMTTWQLIRTLIKLCKQSAPAPMAIALTIHQPSAKLFDLFDSAYVMSYDGQCIYHGPPQTMTGHLGRHGLVCPDYYNPADFVLDIACKEYGIEKVMMLSNAYRSAVSADDNNTDSKCLFEIKTQINDTFRRSLWILIESYLYGDDNGVLSGCAVDFMVIDGDYFEHMVLVRSALFDNSLELVYITIAFCFGATFPACIVFPKEINCFEKECGNGWYSCLAYVLSKIIVDIPFQILMPSLGSFYAYYMTGQYMHPIWRMYTFAVILILISLTASAQGFLFSALFPRNPEVAATLGLTITIPMMLFSGTLARIETMPAPLRVITYFDYLRFGLESMIVNIYGLNRCDDNPLVVNKTDFLQHFSDETLMKIYSSEVIPYEKLLSIVDFGFGSDDHFGNESNVITYYGLQDWHLMQ